MGEAVGVCGGGEVLPGKSQYIGAFANHPELHCTACGGGCAVNDMLYDGSIFNKRIHGRVQLRLHNLVSVLPNIELFEGSAYVVKTNNGVYMGGQATLLQSFVDLCSATFSGIFTCPNINVQLHLWFETNNIGFSFNAVGVNVECNFQIHWSDFSQSHLDCGVKADGAVSYITSFVSFFSPGVGLALSAWEWLGRRNLAVADDVKQEWIWIESVAHGAETGVVLTQDSKAFKKGTVIVNGKKDSKLHAREEAGKLGIEAEDHWEKMAKNALEEEESEVVEGAEPEEMVDFKDDGPTGEGVEPTEEQKESLKQLFKKAAKDIIDLKDIEVELF